MKKPTITKTIDLTIWTINENVREPDCDIGICGDCHERFPDSELPPPDFGYHDGYESPPSNLYYCPSCETGEITEWDMSPERQAEWFAWSENQKSKTTGVIPDDGTVLPTNDI